MKNKLCVLFVSEQSEKTEFQIFHPIGKMTKIDYETIFPVDTRFKSNLKFYLGEIDADNVFEDEIIPMRNYDYYLENKRKLVLDEFHNWYNIQK